MSAPHARPTGVLGVGVLALGAALAPWPRGEAPTPAPVAGPPAAAPAAPPLVVLGIDGMDPELLMEAIERYPDRMPNFAKLVAEGGVHSLGTSIPPQSPVAWSNFITGMNPGGHGVYDFIHRDPVTRMPLPGSVKAIAGSHMSLWGEWQFPLGGGSESNRSGESFWVTLAKHGIPADIWRMPANFPVEPAKGLSFPGMMTPALDSAYGTYTIYASDPPIELHKSGGVYVQAIERDGRIRAEIEGPPNSFKEHDPHQKASFDIYVDHDAQAIAIDVGDDVIVMEPGEWSDFVTLNFELLPAGMMDMSGIVRFYLRSIDPEFVLYASPVNIDPIDPVMPVAEPSDESAKLVDAIGYYYTQGMAEEVNALKDGALDDREFMQQTKLVYDQRVHMMDYALDRYLGRGGDGLFFFYYSTVDLNCHMMWRFHDEQHPQHPLIAKMAEEDSSDWSGRAGSKWKEVVYDLYLLMDPVLGRLRERVGEDTPVVVMSDHGFAPYRRKFSLNRWLVEEGYMVLKDGFTPELERTDPSYAKVEIWNAVDWTRTRAYGMGFNGLYLNLAGREQDDPATKDVDESGIVQPGAEADALLAEIKQKLEALRDGDEVVVLTADLAKDVYHGSRAAEAPDMQVGYNAGYGNSDASSTGRIPHDILADNLGGTFNGNHLMAPEVVPGILLTNGKVRPGEHALEDLTIEILERYGIAPHDGQAGHRVLE
ncbi:MAG: alkaline phosphatase family protein [Planctomycetes bacterium]|nr:alkaline phosphatase family protein [Planctomycetota bacterium]